MPHRRQPRKPPQDKKSQNGRDSKKNSTDGEKEKKNSKNEKTTSKQGDSKMTLCTVPTVAGVRPQVRERRPGRPTSGKRLSLVRDMPAKVRAACRRSLDPCDNSNDSGLGFDHHADPHHLNNSERLTWNGERAEAKRLKMDIKLENDDANDRYCFPDTLRGCKESQTLIRTAPAGSIPSLSMSSSQTSSSGRAVPRCVPLSNRQVPHTPIPLTTQLSSSSKYVSDVSLTIVKQPEQQHRARYQTEGSRGAVKDREGNGFPIVQLIGYYKPTTLQVFIGTDVGKVAPHMFYQACKVSGKNSTPCMEKKIDGTCVIELQLDPSKDMSATCDCVGILKERNVDVEHRFPDQLGNRSKKKSTRCRMIFRTTLTHDDGSQETLQVCSQPIVCTQPPGIPEICKKSLTSCPASGGLELFVLGKNFLKDTKVYFQQVDDERHVRWEQAVVPDKEYLQQTHFVCVIPPYRRPDINEPVTVRLCVVSSGKTSEPHQFVYTPVNGAIPSVHEAPPPPAPFFNKMLWSSGISKREQDLGMMPPPDSSMVPLRRPSISLPSTSDNLSPPLRPLKQEYIDENSQSSVLDPIDHPERFRHISESSLDVHPGDSNMSMINDNSIDMLSHNVENSMSNEGSVEMMVRSSRSMCENSMDVNLSNSQMSSINEDNSCSNVMQHCSNSVVTDRMVMSQPLLMQHSLLATATRNEVSPATAEELKVMDLRMKMPMATVADLVSSSAPSLQTLQSFGVTEASVGPLPAQSAQSVESFLTNIENKDILKAELLPAAAEGRFKPALSSEPVFLSSQRPFLGTTESELVAKSEAAAVAPQTIDSALPAPITTISSIEPNITEKLDQLVNSTVESHIGSKEKTEMMRCMVPPLINTAPMCDMSPAAILNSQISPSLMCRNGEGLCQAPAVEAPLLPAAQNHSLTLASEPEKVVLLKAAVDLLETQKKICELDRNNKMMDEIMTGGNFGLNSMAQDNKADYVIPVPVKDIDKKTEDRMIPQSFTSLTENELINFINPSCFDQV